MSEQENPAPRARDLQRENEAAGFIWGPSVTGAETRAKCPDPGTDTTDNDLQDPNSGQ